MEIKINAQKLNEAINSGELVIVDFFATWCGPCQMFVPVFTETANNNTDIKMYTLDIDEEIEAASVAGIQGVPTIIAYKDGKEISRFSGFKPAEELKQFIESLK